MLFEKVEGKADFDKNLVNYVYILIRKDICPNQQSVQAVHAGMAAIHKFGNLKEDTRLVMLSVQNEEELLLWKDKVDLKGLNNEIFFEPDNNTGWSSLATAPISYKDGKLFKKLRKWSILETI